MRVYCIHPNIKSCKQLLHYLHMSERVDEETLSWDSDKPEILFVSEWIYYRKEYFLDFLRVYPSSGIKVAILREAVEPDLNLMDYALCFHSGQGDDRIIPWLHPIDSYRRFVSKKQNDVTSEDQAYEILKEKTGFCNFLYSNPCAHPMRDKLFYEISSYKKVDSLGCHLNNVGKMGTGHGGHEKDCIQIKAPYRFSISSENATFRGYTSEKLITSLEAHSVPIYWGDPCVDDLFNPECFINAMDFETTKDLVDYIRVVDNDDSRWCTFVSQPWITPAQQVKREEINSRYFNFLEKLFNGQMPNQTGEGFHIGLYRTNYFSGKFPLDKPSLFSRIVNRLKRSWK